MGMVPLGHCYTGDHFLLQRHAQKDYWAHGQEREARSVSSFARLALVRGVILCVEMHIGCPSICFAHEAGPAAHVLALERAPDGLSHTRANPRVGSGRTVIEKVVGGRDAPLASSTRSHTAQNDSAARRFTRRRELMYTRASVSKISLVRPKSKVCSLAALSWTTPCARTSSRSGWLGLSSVS
jgi:hypothetical protein